VIGYLPLGRDEIEYGLNLCIQTSGMERPLRATKKTAKHFDTILASVFWWEQLWMLHNWIGDARPRRLLVGGFNSFNPVPLAEMAEAVFVGDGEGMLARFIAGDEMPWVYRKGAASVRWRDAEMHAVPNVTGSVMRCEVVRGCPYRCAFCSVSHLKTYRRAPAAEVMAAIHGCGQKRASLFGPEPGTHPQNGVFSEACAARGINRIDSDARVDLFLRGKGQQFRRPRFGIEGFSERLRASCGKKISNEDLLNVIRSLISNGQKAAIFMLIFDLPGETEADYTEFCDVISQMGDIPGAKEFTLFLQPVAFMPSPFTPWEREAIRVDINFRDVWMGLRKKISVANKMRIVPRFYISSPAKRVMSMIATRAGAEFPAIAERTRRLRLWSIQGREESGGQTRIVSSGSLRAWDMALTPWGGIERYCGRRDGANPWDVVHVEGRGVSTRSFRSAT